MILPRVIIQFLNGQLGTVGESADGLMALICGAAAVASTMVLNTAYTLTSMDELAPLDEATVSPMVMPTRSYFSWVMSFSSLEES